MGMLFSFFGKGEKTSMIASILAIINKMTGNEGKRSPHRPSIFGKKKDGRIKKSPITKADWANGKESPWPFKTGLKKA